MKKIELSPDNKAVALRATKDIRFAASYLEDLIKRNDLLEDMQGIMPCNIEHYVVDLFKAIGHSSETEKKIKERHAAIKKANMRIHELEKQMGEQGDIDIVPHILADLSDKIRSFWKKDGFGHVSEIHFTNYGHCNIKFSGMLFPDHQMIGSETPESDKISSAKWIQNLKDRGFKLVKESEQSRREEYVIDNDHNRVLIIDLITKRFPSVTVMGFENHVRYRSKNIFTISDIKVFIRILADI